MSSQSVLVPLDSSRLAELAIPYAKALAGACGTITFIHVVPDPEPLRSLYGQTLFTRDDVMSMERETASALMRETTDRWVNVLQQEPCIHIAAGDPAAVILQAVEALGATMIAMASHGRGMTGRLAFGSVADRIARSSDVPVLIVHPKVESPGEPAAVEIQRIVVPLDGSEVSAEAIPVAVALAKSTGVPVRLIQAVNPSAILLPSPVGTSYYPRELFREIADELTNSAEETLTQAEAEVAAEKVGVTRVTVEGAPAAAIEAGAEGGDLIVMTSHGRGGFRRWLLGSVAEKLIRSGIAPVVLVPAKARVEAGKSQRMDTAR